MVNIRQNDKNSPKKLAKNGQNSKKCKIMAKKLKKSERNNWIKNIKKYKKIAKIRKMANNDEKLKQIGKQKLKKLTKILFKISKETGWKFQNKI